MSGKDIKQGGTAIVLDKERHLIFDLNALSILEEEYGSVSKAMGQISKNNKVKDIRHMLYLGLQNEDDKITEKQVGKLVNLKNIKYAVEKIVETMKESTPENDKNEVEQQSPSGEQQVTVAKTVEHK